MKMMRLYQEILLTRIMDFLLNDNHRFHFLQHVQMDSYHLSIQLKSSPSIGTSCFTSSSKSQSQINIVGIDSDFNVSNHSNDHWLKVDRSYVFHIILDCICFQFIIWWMICYRILYTIIIHWSIHIMIWFHTIW